MRNSGRLPAGLVAAAGGAVVTTTLAAPDAVARWTFPFHHLVVAGLLAVAAMRADRANRADGASLRANRRSPWWLLSACCLAVATQHLLLAAAGRTEGDLVDGWAAFTVILPQVAAVAGGCGVWIACRPLLSDAAARPATLVVAMTTAAGAVLVGLVELAVERGSRPVVWALAAVLLLLAVVDLAGTWLLRHALEPARRRAEVICLSAASVVMALGALRAIADDHRLGHIAVTASFTILGLASLDTSAPLIGAPIDHRRPVTAVPVAPPLVATIALVAGSTALVAGLGWPATIACWCVAVIAGIHAVDGLSGGAGNARPALGRIARLAHDLPRALVQHELGFHYRPVVRLADRRLGGVVAEPVWIHPRHGLVGAVDLRRAASVAGLGTALDLHLLERCAQHVPAVMAAARVDEPWICTSIDASSLEDPMFVDEVLQRIAEIGCHPDGLLAAVAASTLSPVAEDAICRLQDAGVWVVLPDTVAVGSTVDVEFVAIGGATADRSVRAGTRDDPPGGAWRLALEPTPETSLTDLAGDGVHFAVVVAPIETRSLITVLGHVVDSETTTAVRVRVGTEHGQP